MYSLRHVLRGTSTPRFWPLRCILAPDWGKYSNDNGEDPELLINKGAKISKPLQKSTFDIKTYENEPITLKPDATKTVITPIKPPEPPPPPPCPTCA
jgi:hypothetical protein